MSNTSEAMIRVFVLTLKVFAPNMNTATMIKIFFIIVPNPKNDCLQFQSVSLHLEREMLPELPQRLTQVVQRSLDDS